MTTTKHALLRMIEVHNATDTTFPAFSYRFYRSRSGEHCLAIEGSFGEIMSALCTALMNARSMSAHDRADIKRAMYDATMSNDGPRHSVVYFPGVPFTAQRESEPSACGVCERCLFGEHCELLCHD